MAWVNLALVTLHAFQALSFIRHARCSRQAGWVAAAACRRARPMAKGRRRRAGRRGPGFSTAPRGEWAPRSARSPQCGGTTDDGGEPRRSWQPHHVSPVKRNSPRFPFHQRVLLLLLLQPANLCVIRGPPALLLLPPAWFDAILFCPAGETSGRNVAAGVDQILILMP